MIGARRARITALLFILSILVILYITTGKRATYSSPFYKRTIEAINRRQNAEAQADLAASEKARQDRIDRVRDEHDAAMAKVDTDKKVPDIAKDGQAVIGISSPNEGSKSVAGRKMLPDGKVVVDESGKSSDGVAKVGNVQAKPPAESATPETEDDAKAEAEINSILKKGPIIIFSKSYCPYSKKAKVRSIFGQALAFTNHLAQNILQNLYSITPPPYVVELDTHPMGPLLQESLGKTTGRRTVPNILISGKSIGGGDDIEKLHSEGKLIETIQSLGGKRIVEIKPAASDSAASDVKKPVRLRV